MYCMYLIGSSIHILKKNVHMYIWYIHNGMYVVHTVIIVHAQFCNSLVLYMS